MTYPLCDQTVTVYHREGQQIIRKVVEDCYYHWQDQRAVDAEGVRTDRKFLLVLPGDTQAAYAVCHYIGGRIWHTEAGRK